MTFDRILEDGRLWAVRYDGENDNCFEELFGRWFDMQWLASFFKDNLDDLKSYFHITDVYEAVMETVEDASRLECLWICSSGIWKTAGSLKWHWAGRRQRETALTAILPG